MWVFVAKIVAVLFALLFGGFALGATSWVWLRKHMLGVGGTCLAVIGAVLIGSPTWKLIEAKVEFNRLQLRLEQQAAQIDALQKQVVASATVAQTLAASWVDSPYLKENGSDPPNKSFCSG